MILGETEGIPHLVFLLIRILFNELKYLPPSTDMQAGEQIPLRALKIFNLEEESVITHLLVAASIWTKQEVGNFLTLTVEPHWSHIGPTTCFAISGPVKEWLIGLIASPAPATPL